ncbi:predicted protein [Nematostella vectensis]|uniref:Uncharacterized protein n=1 Tax=Nematostella vectensis TaxID=45351 RepID=A7S079_NEMVE|nr:predicted protein [Nematostella vectensis]|eukprot:XP_001634978.1 predicted protein [Nematostella vectensis]
MASGSDPQTETRNEIIDDASEKDTNSVTLRIKSPRDKTPLHYTKSTPSFRSREYLDAVENSNDEGRRSRSTSMPLSIEAVKVAKELRRVSDIFSQEKRWPVRRKRRSTIGSYLAHQVQKEVQKSQSGSEENLHYHLPLEGTPV